MKATLIMLAIILVAVFTGTWIFGGLSWLFNAIANVFSFLAKIFDLFGWSSGML